MAKPKKRPTLEQRRAYYAATKDRQLLQQKSARDSRLLAAASRPRPDACELCGVPCSRLHFDHDHKTGQFRGWLCKQCNASLGTFGDDAAGLLRAVHYLRRNTPGVLPADAAARKTVPIASGVLDYFPAAIVEIAKVSYAGNQQHNPGEPLHWARGKSMDQADTLMRHLQERGTIDGDGLRHSAKLAWRALALLQLELEACGAPMARGAK